MRMPDEPLRLVNDQHGTRGSFVQLVHDYHHAPARPDDPTRICPTEARQSSVTVDVTRLIAS
jgi:hypothetical protein